MRVTVTVNCVSACGRARARSCACDSVCGSLSVCNSNCATKGRSRRTFSPLSPVCVSTLCQRPRVQSLSVTLLTRLSTSGLTLRTQVLSKFSSRALIFGESVLFGYDTTLHGHSQRERERTDTTNSNTAAGTSRSHARARTRTRVPCRAVAQGGRGPVGGCVPRSAEAPRRSAAPAYTSRQSSCSRA